MLLFNVKLMYLSKLFAIKLTLQLNLLSSLKIKLLSYLSECEISQELF